MCTSSSNVSEPSYVVQRTKHSAARLLSSESATDGTWDQAARIAWGLPPYRTWFRALWNPDALYLRYDVEDAQPWYTLTTRDAPLWEEEVVEIFIDPDARGHHYAELEISPANVVCDVRMIAPWPNRKMDLAWDIAGLVTHTEAWRDEANVETETGPMSCARGWIALARIPFVSLASLPTTTPLPPAPGQRWKFNVFRIKRPGGPTAPGDGVILAAWSPTGGPSFHVPTAFRDLIFA